MAVKKSAPPKADKKKSIRRQAVSQQSDNLYHNLFEYSKAVMLLIDPETSRIVDANLAACSYYGYTKDELLHEKITAINTLSESEVQAEMDKARSEQRSHFYFEHRLAGGEVHPVEVFTGPVEIGGRQLIYSIIHDITERREAQNALRHSEVKYRTIIQNMQDAYFECDLAGTFTFANETACATLGYTLDELQKLKYQAFTTPETAGKVRQVYEQTLRTGLPSTLVDYEIICKGRVVRVHQLHVGLMRDAAGQPIGFRTVSRDVTERRRAEEKLRASEEKYRSILEKMTEGYFESNIRGGITFVNDAGCAMMGYTREQLCQMDSRHFATPETKEKMDAAYRKVFQTGLPSKLIDYEIIRGDGSIRTHQLSIGLRRDASGRKIGFRAVARDVTEAKRAEEALRQSEERIRVLFNNIPVPTIVWKGGKTGLVLMEFNDAALQFTGGRIIELALKTVEDCYPDAPHIAADMHQCFSLQTSIEKSFWLGHGEPADNKYVTIKYAFAPPDSVIMHINDFTAQKKAEEHLKHISIHDALTGLYNRFYSDAEIARISASRLRPVSFIVIDLNNLKSINDRHGHAAGDLYIKNAAGLFKQTFRPEDMMARIGGDEFIAMLPSVDESSCAQILERLNENLARYNRDADQPISFSAGFSTAHAGDNIEAMIAEADRRMYREKAKMKARQSEENG
ncbi:MAG: PAS domain S-box protein [Deltaproteobacteria bacterium]